MNPFTLFILTLLDVVAELIQLTYEVGSLTRQYVVPAVVFTYVAVVHYVVPATRIPRYYLQVRRERLAATA